MPIKIQYGLSLLISLARNNRRMSLREITKQSKMPYRFLTKVVRELVTAGLVTAKEGKGGGYSLAQNPKAIKAKNILEALGEPLEMTRCLANKGCSSQKKCKLKPVWARIKKFVDQEMDKITLKELI